MSLVNPYTIEIANQQRKLRVDPQQLRQAVATVLAGEGFRRAEVSVAVVDDQAIWQLNREHLQHDYPTDVISWVLEREDDAVDGQIVVSADTATREADEYDWPASAELLLYVVHGTLHLAGYDDINDDDRLEMRQRENHYLQALVGRAAPPTRSQDSPQDTSRSVSQEARDRLSRRGSDGAPYVGDAHLGDARGEGDPQP